MNGQGELFKRPWGQIVGDNIYQYRYPDTYGYPLWSQRDPRWADDTLGFNTPGSKWTIGNYGCMITCVAMALTNHEDKMIKPSQLNTELKGIGGFVGGGNLVFTRVSELYPTFRYEKAVYCLEYPADTVEIEDWLEDGNYAIAKIDMDLTDPDVDEHWVLLTGGNIDKFIIHDPWPLKKDQQPFAMPPAYCKQGWTPARAIYTYLLYENRAPRG